MIDINVASVLYSRCLYHIVYEDFEDGKYNEESLAIRIELENIICDLDMYDEWSAIQNKFFNWINRVLEHTHTNFESDNEIMAVISKNNFAKIVKVWITDYRKE